MIDALIIFAARDLFLLSAALYLVFFLAIEEKRLFIVYSIIVAGFALTLSMIAAGIYNDPRPFMTPGVTSLIPHAPGNGFPSDHTLFTATLAAIVTVYNPLLGIFMWFIAIVVGLARVLARVHHIVDIVGSLSIAAVSVPIAHYLRRYYERYLPRP